MKPSPSSQNPEEDQKIIKLLKDLGSFQSEYPPELFAARRAAFIAQVEQSKARVKDQQPSKEHFIKRLEDLRSVKAEYPPELLAARRSAFIAQIEQLNPIDVSEELASEDQEIIKLLRDLKSAEAEYPPSLFAARRSAFLRQITIGEYSSLLAELRAFLRKIFQYKLEIPRIPISDVLRTSLVIAGLVVAAFIGSLLFEGRELSTNIKIMKDERQ